MDILAPNCNMVISLGPGMAYTPPTEISYSVEGDIKVVMVLDVHHDERHTATTEVKLTMYIQPLMVNYV